MKAKAISEDLLPHAYDLATDPLCSAAVRADLLEKLGRCEEARAEYETGILMADQVAPERRRCSLIE